MAKHGISVTIPNYNGARLLREILPPLFRALERLALPFEVIVSDDCSSDESVSFLKQEFPGVVVLESSQNRGFSATVNAAIHRASLSLVFIMNNDVKLSEDYFVPLLRYFERKDCFGVMGRIAGWDDDEIQDGGKFPVYHGVKIKTGGNYIPAQPQSGGWLPTMYLSGANALVDREKLLLLDGFDEIYSPFYVEDFDLSLRAWRLGWKCFYEHNAVCRHKTSVTIRKKSSKRFINTVYYRNKMILHAIHLDPFHRFFFNLQLAAELLLRLLTFRFFYLNSLRLYMLAGAQIKQSRLRLKEISVQSGHSIIPVSDVIEKIRKELSGISIIRF